MPCIHLTAFIPVSAESRKCYCSHACPAVPQNCLSKPEVHYLRGSVLVVPYPLLHQPHKGCDVVKLSLFQHPWGGTQSTNSVILHRVEWRWFCHKDATPASDTKSSANVRIPNVPPTSCSQATRKCLTSCHLLLWLMRIFKKDYSPFPGIIRNLMVQCLFLHPAPPRESPQSCLLGENHDLWGADGLWQTLGSAEQWHGVLWATASASRKTQNLMT